MSTPEEQSALELETVAIEHHLDMGEALNRLRENEDFKKVVLSGYLEEKALASVSMLAVPAIKKRNERPDVMEDLIAISNLKFYFAMIDQFYESARNPVLSDEEEEELAANDE